MNVENPTTRLSEVPIEGYEAIGKAVNLCRERAWFYARRQEDPLPVWHYLGRALAWPSALREWQARQLVPAQRIDRIKRVDRQKRQTFPNDDLEFLDDLAPEKTENTT